MAPSGPKMHSTVIDYQIPAQQLVTGQHRLVECKGKFAFHYCNASYTYNYSVVKDIIISLYCNSTKTHVQLNHTPAYERIILDMGSVNGWPKRSLIRKSSVDINSSIMNINAIYVGHVYLLIHISYRNEETRACDMYRSRHHITVFPPLENKWSKWRNSHS